MPLHRVSLFFSLPNLRLQFLTVTLYLDVESTTPEGSPAPGFNPLGGPPAQFQLPANGSAAAPDTSSILKALADMAKQSSAAPAALAAPAPAPANPLAALAGAVPPPVSSADSSLVPPAANPFAAAGMGANPYAALAGLAQNPAMPAQPQSQNHTPNPMAAAPNPLAAMMGQANAAPAMPDGNALSQQLQLLQFLSTQGIPQDQWATALQLLNMSSTMGGANPAASLPGFPMMPGQAPAAAGGWGQPDTQNRDDRDRDRDRDYPRSPGGYRRRSRSPGWTAAARLPHLAAATAPSMANTTVIPLVAGVILAMPVVAVGAPANIASAAHPVVVAAALLLPSRRTRTSLLPVPSSSSGTTPLARVISRCLAVRCLWVA